MEALLRLARSYRLISAATLDAERFSLTFPNGQKLDAPNPTRYLHAEQSFGTSQVLQGTTFGGITLDSIYFSAEGRAYPTDFTRLGPGPIQEDLAAVEAEIHFALLGSLEILTILNFEQELIKSKSLNDAVPSGDVEPECRKALSAIQTIRRLAAEELAEELAPYLTGLFFHSMQDLVRFDPGVRLARVQVVQLLHRLMLAGLIIQRIQGLQDPPGADPTPAGSAGLMIDEASREVTVGGRALRLTPTEFKLLLFLSKNPDRLCSRDEILEEVFEIKGSPTKTDKGLLNTHIDRLRKKIDLNPGKHRYIVTLRGEGYKLDLKSR